MVPELWLSLQFAPQSIQKSKISATLQIRFLQIFLLRTILEKEDYLADIVQKQTEELEKISGMSADEAKKMLLEQIKHVKEFLND